MTRLVTRPCRRCRQPKPLGEYPLLDAPRARGWATRQWCADDLIAGGHMTRAQVEAWRRRRVEAFARAQADAARAARLDEYVQQLRARAEADPVFADAVRQVAGLPARGRPGRPRKPAAVSC